MRTSLHAWQPLLDERRTVDGVIRTWSVDPQTRKPKVIERPAIKPWSFATYMLGIQREREIAKFLREAMAEGPRH